MKCPKCGNENIRIETRHSVYKGRDVQKDTAVCQDCGKEWWLNSSNGAKVSEKTWFTILMLFIFFPVGLYFMWKNQKFNIAARVIVTVLLTILFVNVFVDGLTPQEELIVSNTSTQPDSSIEDLNSASQGNVSYLDEKEIPYLYSNTDKYIGRNVRLSGVIFSEPEKDSDGVYFQMFQDPVNSENNTVVAFYGDIDVSNGDYVLIDGEVYDTWEGTNAFGGQISAPGILATNITVSSYQEVVSPTLTTLDLNQSQEQYGYEIILEKVEFAESETRVYLTINNKGASRFSAYPFNMKLIQGTSQNEEQSNWDADYPEIQTDLYSGTSTSGIVCFPPINQSDGFSLYIDAYSDDYEEDISEYVFKVD